MTRLEEIEAAAAALPADEQEQLLDWLTAQVRNKTGKHASQSEAAGLQHVSHSVLDIPTISVGRILRQFSEEDDLLGEMLEERD